MSIRAEVIEQSENRMYYLRDDAWVREEVGSVVSDASYMGVNFIVHGDNLMMIAGDLNPLQAMSQHEHHSVAEHGLAIRVLIPGGKMVARVLETDTIGISQLVRMDYVDSYENITMQILLRRLVVEDDERQIAVGISVNVIDDSTMHGNNVVYHENGKESQRMNLADVDGKETLVTGRRVPRQKMHTRKKNFLVPPIVWMGGAGVVLALGLMIYITKNRYRN